jgi:hypothetical protein
MAEHRETPDTLAWVAAQNTLIANLLATTARAPIRARLTELYNLIADRAQRVGVRDREGALGGCCGISVRPNSSSSHIPGTGPELARRFGRSMRNA